MNRDQIAVILKSFDAPNEVRVMQKGRFELVHLGGITIGRATYEPGWKWSEHVGPSVAATRCPVEHVGLVLSGIATVAFDDGRVIELHAGDLFYVPPVPARQLGHRRSAVRVTTLPRSRELRDRKPRLMPLF
jgi:mannose-6-phosphate isomerase-like protein (cupin superfamily)